MSRRAVSLLPRLLGGPSRGLGVGLRASRMLASHAVTALAPRRAMVVAVPPHSTRGFAAAPSDTDDDVEECDVDVLYPAPQAFVGEQAPRFDAPAFIDGDVGRVKLDDYLRQGKYVCLFFYPKGG